MGNRIRPAKIFDTSESLYVRRFGEIDEAPVYDSPIGHGYEIWSGTRVHGAGRRFHGNPGQATLLPVLWHLSSSDEEVVSNESHENRRSTMKKKTPRRRDWRLFSNRGKLIRS